MVNRPDGCPLFLHKRGYWAKKVRGKLYYFGKDLDKALEQWADEKDNILAGRPRTRVIDGSPTLAELGNLYGADCARRIKGDDLSQESFEASKKTIDRLISFVGADAQPQNFSPLDFADIKEKFFAPVQRTKAIRGGLKGRSVERRSPVTVAGDIRRVRAFLNWCSDTELIPPCRFGKSFGTIKAKQARTARAKATRKLIDPKHLRAIIESATVGLKPLILLGINAGMGAKDLSEMMLEDLPELKGTVWISTHRGKTGAPRRFVLWPETKQAIADWLKVRPKVAPKAEGRLFMTRTKLPWLRNNIDSVSKAFLKTRNEAGIDKWTFYDLRRAFQTVGQLTKEHKAVSYIMGHVVEERDMSGRYTVNIPDAVLKKVCNHVRKWLFES